MDAMFIIGSVKPDEWDHYGLALGQYTHFTSPIRRYADVVVHRLLVEAMKRQDWWSDHSDDNAKGDGKEEERPVLENNALQVSALSRDAVTIAAGGCGGRGPRLG